MKILKTPALLLLLWFIADFLSVDPSTPSFVENEIGDDYFNVTFNPSKFDEEVRFLLPSFIFLNLATHFFLIQTSGAPSCWKHVLCAVSRSGYG